MEDRGSFVMLRRDSLKKLVDNLPMSMEAIALLRSKPRIFTKRYDLGKLHNVLPQACEQVRPFAEAAPAGKRVLIFATLHYWIRHSTLLGLSLAGLGHKVTLVYLPFPDWRRQFNLLEISRQSSYSHDTLKPAEAFIEIVNLLHVQPVKKLPMELEEAVNTISIHDTQYTFESEEVNLDSDFYRLRQKNNGFAARAIMTWLRSNRPDVALVPNGVNVEFGAVYRTARYLNIPTVTYEFSEDRGQIWLAQNEEVVRQDTDMLWQARGHLPLTAEQRQKVEALESARRGARTFGMSDRLWQDVPAGSVEQTRAALGLDERPVVLLATNVIGDSLTLERNVFSGSMSEWITNTIRYFSSRPDIQLVIRVHPGERYSKGFSMVTVVNNVWPQLPENIHVIGPLEKVNTYDIMKLTTLGLIYTTTTGLEMAMDGIPVIIAGDTHYRKRGFTLDPNTWDEYFETLDRALANPAGYRLTDEQVDTAWNYAYRFFFEYPRPFPWRVVKFWKDYETWPLARVLSDEGQAQFGRTFRYMAGEPINWSGV
jgi:hypothetical protein